MIVRVPMVAVLLASVGTLLVTPAAAQSPIPPAAVSGLPRRSIGPALMSGRIADVAVHPRDRRTWYVAVGSGGLWKTTNAGVTFTPVFDAQPSYSIGAVAIDPTSPEIVWVGTGVPGPYRRPYNASGMSRSASS